MTTRPDADIAGATAAHGRLLAAIERLTDADVAQASLLPGWTVGHVLTHLARNADSHVRMLEAAGDGARRRAVRRGPRGPAGRHRGRRRPAGVGSGGRRPVVVGPPGGAVVVAPRPTLGRSRCQRRRRALAVRRAAVPPLAGGRGPPGGSRHRARRGPTGPTTTWPASCRGSWPAFPTAWRTGPPGAASPRGCSTGPPRRATLVLGGWEEHPGTYVR